MAKLLDGLHLYGVGHKENLMSGVAEAMNCLAIIGPARLNFLKRAEIMKKLFLIIGGLFALLAAYLALWPVPIAPLAWYAPVDKGYVGDFASNTGLANLERLEIGDIHGPEDVVARQTKDGLMLYVSSQEGKIIKLSPSMNAVSVLADTGGVALGMEVDADGNLIVADAHLGLLSIAPDGAVTVLTDAVDGTPILYADDLDIADDGVIYFSDASTKFGAKAGGSTLASSLLEIMEHGRTGRLLAYDPATGQTRVVKDGLAFANGVAVTEGGDILVNETGEYRIHRVSPDGSSRIIIDNLPGFPDNINRGPRSEDGRETFLVGLVSQRSEWLDANAAKPAMRKLAMRLPASMRPTAVSYGFILQIDAEGEVIKTWQDPSGSYPSTTGAIMADDGYLYVSSLTAAKLGRLRIK